MAPVPKLSRQAGMYFQNLNLKSPQSGEYVLVHVCCRIGLDTGVAKSDPCVCTHWIWQSAQRQAGAE